MTVASKIFFAQYLGPADAALVLVLIDAHVVATRPEVIGELSTVFAV